MHDITKFKRGDKVRVVRKIESRSGGWKAQWVPGMNKYIYEGKIQEICDIHSDPLCGYKIGEYFWSSDSLELVESGHDLNQTKGEMSMSVGKIKSGVTTIGDVDTDTLSDDTIFGYITDLEGQIEYAKKMIAPSEKMKGKMAALQADIDTLVKLVDGRPAK